MSQRIAVRQVEEDPEAPRVVEAELLAGIQRERDVVVLLEILRRTDQAQAAGHAEVDQQEAGFLQVEDQILRPPPDCGEAVAGDGVE